MSAVTRIENWTLAPGQAWWLTDSPYSDTAALARVDTLLQAAKDMVAVYEGRSSYRLRAERALIAAVRDVETGQ